MHYCYCEVSVWLLCISSVGRSVCSYFCADLLSLREDSLSKGGSIEPTLDLPPGLPRGLGGPRANIKNWDMPAGNFEILHALKCVLEAF